MVTVSKVLVGEHGPFVMVHCKTTVPTVRFSMIVVGLVGSTMVALPDTIVHIPVAGYTALLPAKVVDVSGVQTCWSAPALAAAWLVLNMVMVTVSVRGEPPHGPLLIDHWKMLSPIPNPVISEVGLFGF